MKSTVAKRSIVLAGHKTSISLEDEKFVLQPAPWRAAKGFGA